MSQVFKYIIQGLFKKLNLRLSYINDNRPRYIKAIESMKHIEQRRSPELTHVRTFRCLQTMRTVPEQSALFKQGLPKCNYVSNDIMTPPTAYDCTSISIQRILKFRIRLGLIGK